MKKIYKPFFESSEILQESPSKIGLGNTALNFIKTIFGDSFEDAMSIALNIHQDNKSNGQTEFEIEHLDSSTYRTLIKMLKTLNLKTTSRKGNVLTVDRTY